MLENGYWENLENQQRIIKMRHNMRPWRGDEDDVWLVSMVETFDETMRRAVEGAKIAAPQRDVPAGSSDATVAMDGSWQH